MINRANREQVLLARLTYENILKLLLEKARTAHDEKEREKLLALYSFFTARGYEIVLETLREVFEEALEEASENKGSTLDRQ